MALIGHKTKQNVLLDISDLATLLHGLYLDFGLINRYQYENIKDHSHRLKYIYSVIEARLEYFALWVINTPFSYDNQVSAVTDEYIENEFEDININREELIELLAEFDLNIWSIIPEHLGKPTWQTWTPRLLGSTLLISNQGDYRAIMYFNNDEVHKQKLLKAYPPEVLYQHE